MEHGRVSLQAYIIALWTDGGAYELARGRGFFEYPAGMPASFSELTKWWGLLLAPGFMDQNAKRMLIFAPAKEWWTVIPEIWDNTLMFEFRAGRGLDDGTYKEIITSL